jgi:uncharacterized repeat protein (TIGR01451 family)
MKSSKHRQYLLQLIRSFILLLTTLSYQSLLLLTQANITKVSAQTPPLLCATPGKDGIVNNVGGIINTYYPGATNSTAAVGTTSIPVGAINLDGSTTPIAPGDLLLIIQMQGADINSSNDDSYGDGNPGGGNDTNVLIAPAINGASGNINDDKFTAGNYEYVVATGTVSGGAIPIKGAGSGGGLINSYSNTTFGTQGQRTYQVIRVPQYVTATLNSSLTAAAWNGSSGGILVYDVAGNLNLGSATIDVSGRGFRGGGGRDLDGGAGSNTDYIRDSSNNANGSKGEGTAGTPRFLINRINNTLINTNVLDNGVEGYPGGSYGRGAPGNAGGGSTDGNPTRSNDQNSGGGGGSNGGAGGMGGKSWSSNLFIGGFGGAVFPATSSRIVLGGGGGAGTSNDATSESPEAPMNGIASSGSPGGGMVLLRTGTVSGSGTINANGATSYNVRQDGGGGGGAGGTVVAKALNNNLANLTINANGGDGGKVLKLSDPHGPGGGGGGGTVFASSGAVASVNPGLAGTSSEPVSLTDPTYGGTAGTSGVSQPVGNIAGAGSGAECVPLLTVNKTTSTPGPVNKPGKAIYTITVANAPNRATATQVSVTDPLPNGFKYDAATPPTITLDDPNNGTSTPVTPTAVPTAGATNLDFGTFNIPGGNSLKITFSTDVGTEVADGVYQNGATATYINPTLDAPGTIPTPANTASSSYDSASSTAEDVAVETLVPPPPPPPPLPTPNLSLRGVKRITNVRRNGVTISGVNFNQVIDEPTNPDDDTNIWSTSPLSPTGVTRIDPQLLLQTGDEVEYTIYYLVDGNQVIPNAKLCDRIPAGTTFINDSFGSQFGISLNTANNLTLQSNSLDADKASFFQPVAPLPANNVCTNQTNPTGAVLVDFGNLDFTPGNNFGFLRFRVRVD